MLLLCHYFPLYNTTMGIYSKFLRFNKGEMVRFRCPYGQPDKRISSKIHIPLSFSELAVDISQRELDSQMKTYLKYVEHSILCLVAQSLVLHRLNMPANLQD